MDSRKPAARRSAKGDLSASPPWWSTPPANAMTQGPQMVVGVGGQHYPCPDLDSIDGHITQLWQRLQHARAWARFSAEQSAMVRVYNADIDRLLDMRPSLRARS